VRAMKFPAALFITVSMRRIRRRLYRRGFYRGEVAEHRTCIADAPPALLISSQVFLQRIFAAADDEHFCAERGEVQRHGTAEASSAAAEKNCAPFRRSFWNIWSPPEART